MLERLKNWPVRVNSTARANYASRSKSIWLLFFRRSKLLHKGKKSQSGELALEAPGGGKNDAHSYCRRRPHNALIAVRDASRSEIHHRKRGRRRSRAKENEGRQVRFGIARYLDAENEWARSSKRNSRPESTAKGHRDDFGCHARNPAERDSRRSLPVRRKAD